MSQKNMTDFFTVKKVAATKKQMEPEPEQEEKPQKKSKGDSAEGFPAIDDLVDDLCSWKGVLSNYTKTSKFQNTYKYVKQQYAEHTCYPLPNEIFNVFKQTPLKSLKVVIVGQDPYHQPGQAMGLCFSVKKGVKVPPSLANMYKSLAADPKIKGFKTPNHGDLTKWANQGVFLLNDILTVEDSKPNAHQKGGWADFTSEVIRIIDRECKDIVFLLWGAPAMKKASVVDQKKHHILTTTHPSPLSCHRGFADAFPFSACNDVLSKLGKTPIDWQV